MLHFIYGKHASGKTEALIKNILGPAAEETKQTILIVPRQITFQTDEMLLNLLGPQLSSEIDVLSFKRLCDQVMKTVHGIDKKILGQGVNAIIMNEVANSFKGEMKAFRGESNIVFVQNILEQIRFLKTSCKTPEHVFAAAQKADGTLKNKLLDLHLLYSAYEAVIGDRFIDENDLVSVIYTTMNKSGFFKGKIIALDGFSTFSVQQMKMIILAIQTAEEVYITVNSDNIFDKSKASPYSSVNATVRRLLSCFKKETGIDAEYDTRRVEHNPYNSSDIELLEKTVYRTDAKSECFNGDIVLYCGSSVDDECDFVARQIKKLLRASNYSENKEALRCRDIAVAFRSFDFYPSRLENSFKKYGVPFFEDSRSPIANSPLIVMTSALIELASKPAEAAISQDSVMKYAKCGLFGYGDFNENEDFIIDEKELTLLENYCYIWDIKGCEFFKPFFKNPEGFNKTETKSTLQQLEALNETRKKIIEPVEAFRKIVLAENVSVIDYCKAVFDFLEKNRIALRLKSYACQLEENGNLQQALEQDNIWNALIEALEDIVSACEEKQVDVTEMPEIFDIVISTKTLGRLPSHFDEVTLCSYDRLPNVMPKVLFSIGCSEGTFPNYNTNFAFFSENERRLLLENDTGLAPDDSENVEYERYLVYHALVSAREKLFVTCSLTGLKGDKSTPSDIFSLIKRTFCEIKITSRDDSFEENVQSEKSAFDYLVRHFFDNSPEIATLRQYFSSKEKYTSRIATMDNYIDRKPFSIQNEKTAVELFGKEIILSPSGITKFEKCPFQFFCSNGLRLKEREKAKFDKRIIGDLVHYALDRLLSKHKFDIKNAFAPENESTLKSEVIDLLIDFLHERMGGEDDKNDRFRILYYRAGRVVDAAIKRLIFEFSCCDYTPVEFEEKIGDDQDIVSPVIDFDSGRIKIQGQIDRRDHYSYGDNVYVKIVDYKSGSKSFNISDVLNGTDMQMVIYLIAVIDSNGENKYLPGGLVYNLADATDVALKDGTRDSIEDLFLKDKMSGMLLDSDDNSHAFTQGLYEKVFPKSKFTLEQFNELKRNVIGIIEQMGRELHGGRIEAMPKGKTVDDVPCIYCSYSSICARSEINQYIQIKNYSTNIGQALKNFKEENGNGVD